jgi:hypothetical protein
MSGTLIVAIYGAATGTIGTILSLITRRDAVWGRRGRARDLRPALDTLRDVIAEAKATPRNAHALTSTTTFRVLLDELDEQSQRCPDRKTRTYVRLVHGRCLAVVQYSAPADSATDQVRYQLMNAIDRALTALTSALDRLDRIDRRAP